MKILFLPLLLAPSILMADPAAQTVRFTPTSLDKDYGLFVLAAETDCPATRFLVVGEGGQSISEPLSAGQGVVLALGQAFVEGEHEVQVSAVGCDAEMASLPLVILNQSSPGHGGGVDLLIDGTVVAKN